MPANSLDLLFKAFQGANSALILPHNDPDPDAIASAVALGHLLAGQLGIDSRVSYGGIIGRAENRALQRYLDNPLQPLADGDLRQGVPVVLVDTQPGAGNNPLPAGAAVAVVIDHHPLRAETAAASFADVRPGVGATSTILTEYLQMAGLELPVPLATALFYGIKTDTGGLSRGASSDDVVAYLSLLPQIDILALAQVERSQVPADYFRSLSTALGAALLYDGVLVTYLGTMAYPDLAAEMADILLRSESAQWVICMGIYRDRLILSVRTQDPRGKAGSLARAMVAGQGTAGGHGTSAGGQVSLDDRSPGEVVRQLRHRALKLLQVSPQAAGEPLL
jgi:nanoRNase/pAp phosphatase (c-di-AMP/oligoRNAs hydrolase)